jgi:hypothetical protein
VSATSVLDFLLPFESPHNAEDGRSPTNTPAAPRTRTSEILEIISGQVFLSSTPGRSSTKW